MTESEDTKVYVGATHLELLRVLWSGYQDGLAYGRAHPIMDHRLLADHVVESAQQACECKLQTEEPLDRTVFHPAYTHGWITGYLVATHALDDAVDGLPLLDPARLAEYARQAETRRIMH